MINATEKVFPNLISEKGGPRESHLVRDTVLQKTVHLLNFLIIRPQNFSVILIYEPDSSKGEIIEL